MKVTVLTLRFQPDVGGFATDKLDEMVASDEIISAADHLFFLDGLPYLTLVVCHRERPQNFIRSTQAREPSRKDWRTGLDPIEACLYDALRTWRAEEAKKEGVPHYLILNNRQMAEVASQQPTTLTALQTISGIGGSKVDKFGRDIVQLVATMVQSKEVLESSNVEDTSPMVSHGGTAAMMLDDRQAPISTEKEAVKS